MNVDAGLSRIGTENLLCATCHVNASATNHGNDEPHAAPRVATVWRQ